MYIMAEKLTQGIFKLIQDHEENKALDKFHGGPTTKIPYGYTGCVTRKNAGMMRYKKVDNWVTLELSVLSWENDYEFQDLIDWKYIFPIKELGFFHITTGLPKDIMPKNNKKFAGFGFGVKQDSNLMKCGRQIIPVEWTIYGGKYGGEIACNISEFQGFVRGGVYDMTFTYCVDD